ncbi:MAG: FemAB family XrtA/PEP-CTERM system-associated protein [Planctomycetaceae bacterium]
MELQSEILRPPVHSLPRTDSDIRVHELTPDYEGAWNDYVAEAADCSPFHELGWMRAVERIYRHRPRYLVASSGSGRLMGVLPLFEVAGPFTGRALISVPYAVSGGASAVNEAVATALHDRTKLLAERMSVRYAEIRAADPIAGFSSKNDYVSFRKPIPDYPKDVLDTYPRKARAAVRNAIKRFGLQSRFGHELLDEFYKLYALSLRRLGSPPHAKSFFRELLHEFGDRCIVQLVYHEGRAIAGVISFRFQHEILPYWAGIDVRYNHTNASNFLYYSLMEHAIGLKLEIFDFGRTRIDNEGGCRFKIHQGFDPLPLAYSTYSPAGTPPPDLRPSNRKFGIAQAVWRRLPLGVVTMSAKTVTRWLP